MEQCLAMHAPTKNGTGQAWHMRETRRFLLRQFWRRGKRTQGILPRTAQGGKIAYANSHGAMRDRMFLGYGGCLGISSRKTATMRATHFSRLATAGVQCAWEIRACDAFVHRDCATGRAKRASRNEIEGARNKRRCKPMPSLFFFMVASKAHEY